MVSIFKYTHSAKRTFNDLKLQNIMINVGKTLDDDPEVFLIDFGFSKKYVNKDKEHITQDLRVKRFQGNMFFSSVHHMSFLQTSRVDDLISLFYMLIHMLNDQKLWIGDQDPFAHVDTSDRDEIFKAIRHWKKRNDLRRIALSFSK